MGYQKKLAERCLRAAYGDPNRAFEYIENGIPQQLEQLLDQQEQYLKQQKQNKNTTTKTAPKVEKKKEEGSSSGNPLEDLIGEESKTEEKEIDLAAILSQIPNFDMIRQTIQQKA